MMLFEPDIVSPPSDSGAMGRRQWSGWPYPRIAATRGVEAIGDGRDTTRTWLADSNHNPLNNLLRGIAPSEYPLLQQPIHEAARMVTSSVYLQLVSPATDMSQ